MQGTELLRDPSFAQTLERSPFQAKDLPGLSTAIADTFDRLTPEQRKEFKSVLDELDDLPAEELKRFLEMISYVEKNPDQYPRLIEQFVKTGAFEREDMPEQYDPNLMAVVKTLVFQALRKVLAASNPVGFAKGGIADLKQQAKKVAAAGRGGDTILAHITPQEAAMLKKMGGSGTINPMTGLLEFKSIFGQILKVGAQIIATAALSFFTGPIAAGAIVGGASALLSGAKPIDALKSALIGGAIGGIGGGISSSLSGGSFMEGAFSGGSLFGSKPYETFLSRALSGTSLGDAVFGGGAAGGAPAGGAATTGAETAAGLKPVGEAGSLPTMARAGVPQPSLTPQTPIPTASASPFSLEGIKSLWSKYPIPIALGGGAALIALSNSQKEDIKPSLLKGQTGADLLSQQPETYGFNIANFSPRTPQAPNPVFPTGGYIAPSTPIASAPMPNFGQVRYPTTGIMGAKVGGHINGPGTGTSDSIPARLSDGEFVMTARAVRGAGKGDRMKGARKMYELMHKFERMA